MKMDTHSFFPANWKLNFHSLDKIADNIGIPENTLRYLNREAFRLYREIPPSESGVNRPILAPNSKLKSVQKLIIRNIFNFQFPSCVQGGVPNRSIVTNAKLHREKSFVATFDIKKFFLSVHYSKIKNSFTELGCSKEITNILLHLTTLNFQLPQGAPTSPILANLVMFDFDRRVQKLCSIRNLVYSRYFDDITISGDKVPDSLCKKVVKIAKNYGFIIYSAGKKKYTVQSRKDIQLVNSIVVNSRVLKPNPIFIEELAQRFKTAETGKIPADDYISFWDKTRGMIAFLESVNVNEAKVWKGRLNKIMA